MRIRIGYLTSTLGAAATAVAIVAAPTAAAASGQGPASGNAQIYDAPPQVDYLPYAGGAT